MATLLTPTVIWAILGLVLLIVELTNHAFVIVFFGVAALAVAGLKAATGLENTTVEILLFAAIGGACLYFFRSKLLRATRRGGGGMSIDRSQIIDLTADIAPGATAKTEYQGTLWDATNASDKPLRAGDKAIIVTTQGIKLVVRPLDR